MTTSRLCRACGQRPVTGEKTPWHPNARYCAACRRARRRRPASNVTPAQADALQRLLHARLPRQEIAARLGLSLAAIKRYLRETQQTVPPWNAYPPAVVEAVCTAYVAAPPGQGKQVIREQFPGVNVRSIIERYCPRPRQIRWTPAQVIEAVRMAGLVSQTAQARYFARPNAYEGSLKKLWTQTLRCAPRDLHGLGAALAFHVAVPGVPAVLVAPQQGTPGPTLKVLWVDLVQHLRPDVPPEIRAAMAALAQFQAWLFASTDTHAIRTLIQERETYAATKPCSEQQPQPAEDPLSRVPAHA